jgi:hypothetical protein
MSYYLLGLYIAIGICMLVKGVRKYGRTEGLTALVVIVAWPFFTRDILK